ncbi:hypothetical protein GCM10027403_37000 [Arthrobacter tecti]
MLGRAFPLGRVHKVESQVKNRCAGGHPPARMSESPAAELPFHPRVQPQAERTRTAGSRPKAKGYCYTGGYGQLYLVLFLRAVFHGACCVSGKNYSSPGRESDTGQDYDGALRGPGPVRGTGEREGSAYRRGCQ